MFFQASQPNSSPISSHKKKGLDPDSHAHSPRSTRQANLGFLDIAVGGTLTDAQMMPPPAFKTSRQADEDPFFSQFGMSKPDPVFEGGFLRDIQPQPRRKVSSSGDISMPDRPPRSSLASSEHDQSMVDYTRPVSPVSSLRSYSMPDYSRPSSPISRRNRSSGIPSWSRPGTPIGMRQVSTESSKSPRILKLTDGGHDVERQSSMQKIDPVEHNGLPNDHLEAISPHRLVRSDGSAPVTSVINSALNTPMPAAKPSAAAEARASSYSGKARNASNTSRDASNAQVRASLEAVARSASNSSKCVQHRPEIGLDSGTRREEMSTKIPSVVIKSKKEGKTREASDGNLVKPDHNTVVQETMSFDKENTDLAESNLLPIGDQKRRRTSGKAFSATKEEQDANDIESPKRRSSKHHAKTESPCKPNDVDDLTSEGVVARRPLGELDNIS